MIFDDRGSEAARAPRGGRSPRRAAMLENFVARSLNGLALASSSTIAKARASTPVLAAGADRNDGGKRLCLMSAFHRARVNSIIAWSGGWSKKSDERASLRSLSPRQAPPSQKHHPAISCADEDRAVTERRRRAMKTAFGLRLDDPQPMRCPTSTAGAPAHANREPVSGPDPGAIARKNFRGAERRGQIMA